MRKCSLDEGVSFPTRLRKMRERKRVKRYIVSELCGLSRDAVRRYERGEREPSARALAALADYFDVTMDFLWKGE